MNRTAVKITALLLAEVFCVMRHSSPIKVEAQRVMHFKDERADALVYTSQEITDSLAQP
jgi:hypothetical protein